MNLEVSLCSHAMNRTWLVKGALPSWLDYPFKEIIFTDWSSTDGLEEFIDEVQDGRITRIHIPGQEYFNPSSTRNVAYRKSSCPVILFIDCDCVLHRDIFDEIEEHVVKNSQYLRTKSSEETGCCGLMGTCVVTREMYEAVGAYNDRYEWYGGEDVEFYELLDEVGYKPFFADNWAHHLTHSVESRVKNFWEKDIRRGINRCDQTRNWDKAVDVPPLFHGFVHYPDGRVTEGDRL